MANLILHTTGKFDVHELLLIISAHQTPSRQNMDRGTFHKANRTQGHISQSTTENFKKRGVLANRCCTTEGVSFEVAVISMGSCLSIILFHSSSPQYLLFLPLVCFNTFWVFLSDVEGNENYGPPPSDTLPSPVCKDGQRDVISNSHS